MGHFERGRWVETTADNFVTAMVNINSAFAEVPERMREQLIEWDNSSDVFRKGRHMKHSDLMAEWWMKHSVNELIGNSDQLVMGMKTKEEILEHIETSKRLYFDEGCPTPMYIKGWIYALRWVLSDDEPSSET